MPSPISPRVSRRARGFSLVLSLTVMAMLLLLCISIAALLAVELRVGRASLSRSKAKLNALAGARIALGEVQRLLGPDQRVSATADLLPINHKGADLMHPHWTGVWNSGPDADGLPWLQRTDGVLQDTRTRGAGWGVDRVDGNRQLAWLVSGNEGLSPASNQADYWTPYKNTIGQAKSNALLLGPGSLGQISASATPATSPLVSVPRVQIDDGDFAYWVSDEGVKARFNLGGIRAKVEPTASSPQNGGYARLTHVVRNNFDLLKSAAGDIVIPEGIFTALDPASVAQTTSFDTLTFAGIAPSTADAIRQNLWHDITFDSRGVLADSLNGGLKKDLTGYTEANPAGTTAITRDPNVGMETDFSDSDRIFTADNIRNTSPTWSLLRSWVGKADADRTAIGASTPATTIAPVNFSYTSNRYQLPDYLNNTTAARSPLLAHAAVHFTPYYDAARFSANAGSLGLLVLPRVVLWNPYSVPIKADNLRVNFCCLFDVRLQMRVPKVPGGAIDSTLNTWVSSTNVGGAGRDTTETRLRFQIAPNTILAPGEVVIFQAPSGNPPMAALGQYNTLVRATNAGNTGFTSFTRGSTDNNSTALIATGLPAAIAAGTPTCVALKFPSFTVNGTSFDPLNGREAFKQVHLLDSGNQVLQQIDDDGWASPSIGYGNGAYTAGVVPPLSPVMSTTSPTLLANGLPEAIRQPAQCSMVFRYPYFDDLTSANGGGLARNKEFNGLVSYNFRATRFTRFPNDGTTLQRLSKDFLSSLYTTEMEVAALDDARYAHINGTTSPLFSTNSLSGVPGSGGFRFLVFDVPLKEPGVTCIGALQSAPFIPYAWAPALAFGNAYPHPGLPLDRTGWGISTEPKLWNDTFAARGTPTVPAIIKQNTSDTLLLDWSFELNNALWDGWCASGIPQNNPGWMPGAKTWEITSITGPAQNDTTRFRDERLTPYGDSIATDCTLFKAPQSLLLDGAFNINSTSIPAWKALLSSTRDIKIPLADGTVDAAPGVAFLRTLRPAAGTLPASPATFNPTAWAGFRRLDENEVELLARKIVDEVKMRGPFLGLADFVNRRLMPGPIPANGDNSAIDGNRDAYDYLGALQSAIERAELNKRFDGGDTNTLCDRNTPGAQLPSTFPADSSLKPEQRVHHRAAGAAAYLLQGDILRQIGGSISARSDTFKIRTEGRSDGTRAILELTIQRTPDAVIPHTEAGITRAYVPKHTTDGRQFLGRRMRVIATRWITPDSI